MKMVENVLYEIPSSQKGIAACSLVYHLGKEDANPIG